MPHGKAELDWCFGIRKGDVLESLMNVAVKNALCAWGCDFVTVVSVLLFLMALPKFLIKSFRDGTG